MQFSSVGRAYRRPRAATNLRVPEERPRQTPDLTGLEDYPQPMEQLLPYEPPMAEVIEVPVERLPQRVLQRVTQSLKELSLHASRTCGGQAASLSSAGLSAQLAAAAA